MKNSTPIKLFLRKICSIRTFYIAQQTLENLENIRINELNSILNMLPPEGKLLEIGVGTGW